MIINKKALAIGKILRTNHTFRIMSATALSLKNILEPAKGKDRLPVLTKLCALPSFWGEPDELIYLEETRRLAHEIGTEDEQARAIFLLGKFHLRKARFDLATDGFNEALKLYESTANIRGKAECKINLGIIDNARSSYDKALSAGIESEMYSEKVFFNKGLADALLLKAMAHQNFGEFNRALQETNKALEIYESLQDIYGMASAYHHIGIVNDARSNYPDALESLAFSLKIREDIGDRFGIAETLNAIGVIHWKQSSHLEGIKQLFRALKIEEETGDKYAMAISYNCIGNINSNLANYDDALKYYLLAQQICIELDRKKGVAASYYNIGIIHYEQHNFTAALENHLKSLELNLQIGHKEAICGSYNYTGKVYAALGRYDEALPFQFKAVSLGQEIGDKRRIGIAYTGVGATQFYLGDYDNAIIHLLKALEIGIALGEKTIIKDALFTLVEVHKKTGKFEQALNYYTQYYDVQNQISSESVQKQLTTLNFQHSLEVKEKESALLKEKNEEIQRYLHKLEISNNELKQFAHVAAHDLREPLRMISQYMALLDQSISGNLNDAQKKFIGFAIDGSRRMELLIEDMLRLAKVDADPKVEKIELGSVITEIKLNLSALMHEKSSRIIMDDLPPVMADRTQMLQLFQNIIGNGMKYNESEHPIVEIRHEIKGKELQIFIADNGIGIPAPYREKAFQIFQRVPTEKKYAGSGIGLAICKKIVDSMNGKIWVEDNPGGGTLFRISFKDALAA